MTRGIRWVPLVAMMAFVDTEAAIAQDAGSRRGWTLGVGVGPAQIDDLAGAPNVPTVSFERTVGSSGQIGGRVGWIGDAGLYSLNAVTLDLGFGIRGTAERTEGSVVVGPTAILGGDSDGTPYLGIGPHVTLAGTVWLSSRVGVQGAGIGRVWFGTGTNFNPALVAGLTFRL